MCGSTFLWLPETRRQLQKLENDIGLQNPWSRWVDLWKPIARLERCLCVTELEEPNSIMALMACRLIPLDKDPGLRPIAVGEVLRRIIGKAVTKARDL